MDKNTVYVAIDVEASGSKLGLHSMLSLGACVVSREMMSYAEYNKNNLIFYAELKPSSLLFEKEAMKVGASQLECLETARRNNPLFDPSNEIFDPYVVLQFMKEDCETPDGAMWRFERWVKKHAGEHEVVGVTDTVFFDSGYFNLCFGSHSPSSSSSPFGWKGLDLGSLYKGYEKRSDVHLKELHVPDNRTKPHRADHDAVYLAQIAHELLFEKLKW